METIKKLDPHPYTACIQRSGESEGIIPIGLVHDHFQDYLILLKSES